MSELNLGPAQQSSPAKAIGIAVVVLAAVAAGVFYLNPRKTAELQVTKVQTYTYVSDPVKIPKGVGGEVVDPATTVEHDLYVVATVRVDNKLRLPLFINGIRATYTAADGSEQEEHAASLADINRLEEIFPDLKPMLPHPLTDPIAPKSVSEGQVLLEFPKFNEDIWKQRKSASLTVDFTHQAPITVAIP